MYEKLQSLGWMDGMLAVGLGLIAAGVGMNLKGDQIAEKVVLKKVTPTVTVIQSNVEIVIDMAGEIMKPGVYRLKKGSRVEEALIAAEGLGAKADREWVTKNINRAAVLNDGEKIFIPKVNNQETTTKKQTEVISNQVLGKAVVNINTGTVEELDKLPGVGPAMAAKIIEYREKNSGFKDINEIKSVSGIGDKLYERIKDLIEL